MYFLNINNPDRLDVALIKSGKSSEEVDIITCSDGEQILGRSTCRVRYKMTVLIMPAILNGIGDQRVGGSVISIAKLVLCTICVGIHPENEPYW